MAPKHFAYRQQQATDKAKEPQPETDAMALRTSTTAMVHSMNCLAQRGYTHIGDYELFCDEEELAKKMQCDKRARCSGHCCLAFADLDPFCDPKLCKNRAVTDGRYKVLGEQEVFGMDQHTRICIETALPAQTRELWLCIEKLKSHLISSLLLPAINRDRFFVAEHPRFRSKYDPMAMVKPNETEAQFMLTDVLRAKLFEE